MRDVPRILLEELDGDDVVVRIQATPERAADGPQLATEVLAAIAPTARGEQRASPTPAGPASACRHCPALDARRRSCSPPSRRWSRADTDGATVAKRDAELHAQRGDVELAAVVLDRDDDRVADVLRRARADEARQLDVASRRTSRRRG